MENKNWRYTWTEPSVQWYEDADSFTGYNRKLAAKIKRYLEPADHIFELACGTGCLARKLAPFVSRYTANDMDENALAFLRANMPENMEPVQGDWRQVCRQIPSPDITLFQQFSGILSDWELLKQVTGRYVIAVLPNDSHAVRHHEPEAAERKSPSSGRPAHLESYGSCCAFLDQREVPYHLIEMTLDFGQPFRTLEDAEAYFRHFHSMLMKEGDPVEIMRSRLQPTDLDGYKYFCPKEKEIGILVASAAE